MTRIYVCMHVCIYVCVCVCMCVCMYSCMYVLFMYACMSVCMYACMYVCMFGCKGCMHAWFCVHVCLPLCLHNRYSVDPFSYLSIYPLTEPSIQLCAYLHVSTQFRRATGHLVRVHPVHHSVTCDPRRSPGQCPVHHHRSHIKYAGAIRSCCSSVPAKRDRIK